MPAPALLLSIVCPVFKEETILPPWHKKLAAVLKSLEPDWRAEILYVDDGSPDQSLAVIKQLAAQDESVRFLSLSRSFGTDVALLAGMEHARGDVVITLDGKQGHPPQLILDLLKKWGEGCEIVVGARVTTEQPSLLTRIFSKPSSRAQSLPADYCLLGRKAVHGLLRLRESNRSLCGMIGWLGFPTGQVSFTTARSSTVSGPASLSSGRPISSSPLRLASYFGGAAVTIGLAHVVWLVMMMVLGHADTIPLWNYLVTALQLTSGAILCCLGVMGEYVGRIFEQVKRRPNYLFKDQSADELSREVAQPSSRHAA